MKNVLLIHGLAGGERDYRATKRYFSKKNSSLTFYSFLYEKRFGQVHLTDIADELATYIRANLEGKTFSIIGFSQGGLIARALVMQHPDIAGQIERVITVCTPHHGSFLAYFAFGKGISDLRPHSAFLKSLDAYKDSIEYYAVYDVIDPVVLPGLNARFERAVRSQRIAFPSHYLSFGYKKTLTFIESVLI